MTSILTLSKQQEKLIELVKQRPLLYDLCDVDNKNRVKKAKAWLDIAKEMGSNDVSLWRYKWKGLKDNYTKYKKYNETSAGQAYKKYKNWPWADNMKFLDNYNTAKKTIEIRRINQDDLAEMYNRDSHHNAVIENSPVEEFQDSGEGFESIDSSKISGTLQNNPQLPNERCGLIEKLDGTDLFFLSYSQTFKTLPSRMQTMLKLEIATLFARYETIISDGRPPESINSPQTMREVHENYDEESLNDPLTDVSVKQESPWA
ncbi:uncharacterized protein LOC116413460 [Galleria mellonella]|uniref:Uncharacterized protein LOC116413460 n=1 Tax=Galleria mellonella TaxID=7137 RepID=A0A6J3CAA5_GALME|nr:uncharacterized protein LOC116413460 [Galleria mellonella]